MASQEQLLQLLLASNRNIRRAYQVVPVKNRKRIVRSPIIVKGEDGERTTIKWEERSETVADGYMVHFPMGHSLFVDSREELERLKLAGESGFVDVTTGDAIEDITVPSLAPIDRIGVDAAVN